MSITPKDVAAPRYLPGLNGIRAIASLIIIAAHVDEFSFLLHKHEIGFNANRFCLYAVTIFFVLSGYLITFLLIKEKVNTGKIAFRRFYTRRILRLWPVYYLMVIVALVITMIGGIIPEGYHQIKYLLWFVFLIPNVPFALGGLYSFITPMWSIGVDEQFYAFWPFIVNRTNRIGRALCLFIVGYFLIKAVLQFIPHFANISLVMAVSRLDCMAIGGLGAYLVLNPQIARNAKTLAFVYSRWVQLASWLLVLASMVFHSFHIATLIDHELYSVIFLILIVNVSTNPRSIVNLERNRPMNFLGRITYSLQMYHLLLVYLICHFFSGYFAGFSDNTSFLVLLTVTLAVSIPLAWLSYNYFEMPFLNLKKRLGKVSKRPPESVPSIFFSETFAVKTKRAYICTPIEEGA